MASQYEIEQTEHLNTISNKYVELDRKVSAVRLVMWLVLLFQVATTMGIAVVLLSMYTKLYTF